MSSLNKVLLIGNLTKDPDLKQLPSGTNVSDLRLAVNDPYVNKEGEKVESTCFLDVVVWGNQADACKKYLGKGSSILVEGRLQQDQWVSPEGENRSKIKIKADRIQFLSKKIETVSNNISDEKPF